MNYQNVERIMCMQHCSQDENIFFLNFPSICPICGVSLQNCKLIVPPFCVPSPLLSASHADLHCCLVIKKTRGDFLRDFQNGEYLHIGITDSNGQIFNYDERGLIVERTNWEQCAMIKVDCSDTIIWDSVLQDSENSPLWTKQRYQGTQYNCYDYVISMLQQMNKQQGLSCDQRHIFSKEVFSRNFILPLTTKVAKYIELYRNIKSQETVVLPIKGNNS